jgi:hypothetical protein
MIDGRHNVIKGEFSKPGQTDWAVLCSVGRVSSVLVFWNGSETNPAEIAKRNDVDRLQGWGATRSSTPPQSHRLAADTSWSTTKPMVEKNRLQLTMRALTICFTEKHRRCSTSIEESGYI